jgi:threonine/homoserine/homoserine lactone efflux protein
VIKALLIGAAIAVPQVLSVGPGFVAQIEMGVSSGYRACASVVAGLYSCSVLVITASFLGIVRFLNDPGLRFGLSLFNGCLILAWGTVKIISSHAPPDAEKALARRKASAAPASCYLRGFVLSLSNPIALFFWVNIVTLANINFGIRRAFLPFFMIGLVGAAIALDFIKCGLLSRSRKFFKPRVLELVNRAMGVVLVGMGAYLIVRVF